MRVIRLWGRRASTEASSSSRPRPPDPDQEFRVLDFLRRREAVRRPPIKKQPVPPPRALSMPTDQHWPSVWPGPRSFHPASVPLPMHQGYPMKNQAPPGAYANAELMKIPNFLHLTPPAIKAQCEAIKKFCTAWPVGLEDDEKCQKKFPLEIITADYCHSGPSIRDTLSRIVTLRIKMSSLSLDKHAKDKIMRLLGDKYDEKTDNINIVVDRCPVRKQNMEYGLYLLTAVFHESWVIEPWEVEKVEADMEEYIWEKNESRKSVIKLYTWKPEQDAESSEIDFKSFDVSVIPGIEDYKEAVSELMNVGENAHQMEKYKQAVLKLLGLPAKDEIAISVDNKE